MNAYTIRPATPDDAHGINTHLRRIAEEPHNMISYAPGEFVRTVDEERARIERALTEANSHMLVAAATIAADAVADDMASGAIIGMCTCFGGVRIAKYNTSLGIMVRREWRDQGVGTALMTAMIAWARENPAVHRVAFTVLADNARAIHVYRKLGFQEEGVLKEACYKDGRFADLLMMAMLFNDGP